jgi:nucleoside-diphosphate-sugar epimerase
MLEACRKNSVDKFVFASSGAPLGEVEPPIHEEKVPRPVSPYGASKLAGEAYCNAYYKTFGIKTVVLRFGNVYGPRSSHKTSVVAKFFKRALEGLPLEIYGDGTQTRDFIYVEDLCNAIYLSLKALSPSFHTQSLAVTPNSSLIASNSKKRPNPKPSTSNFSLLTSNLRNDSSLLTSHSSLKKIAGEVFQIATFKETTMDEIASKIKELADNGTGKKVEIIYSDKRLGDVQRTFSDISKARNHLDFQPMFDLDKGLSTTWEYYREKKLTEQVLISRTMTK